MTEQLAQKRCIPCEGGALALEPEQIANLMSQIEGWTVEDNKKIKRLFHFKNFYHSMAFVNAIAWLAHQENHHPDMEVGYNYCTVRYTTHAAGGLTHNDFICASKVDRLFAEVKK